LSLTEPENPRQPTRILSQINPIYYPSTVFLGISVNTLTSRKGRSSGVESHTPSQTLLLVVAFYPTLRSTQPLTESELEVQSPLYPVAIFRLRGTLPPSSIHLRDYGQHNHKYNHFRNIHVGATDVPTRQKRLRHP
jgi:hypothetical protein